MIPPDRWPRPGSVTASVVRVRPVAPGALGPPSECPYSVCACRRPRHLPNRPPEGKAERRVEHRGPVPGVREKPALQKHGGNPEPAAAAQNAQAPVTVERVRKGPAQLQRAPLLPRQQGEDTPGEQFIPGTARPVPGFHPTGAPARSRVGVDADKQPGPGARRNLRALVDARATLVIAARPDDAVSHHNKRLLRAPGNQQHEIALTDKRARADATFWTAAGNCRFGTRPRKTKRKLAGELRVGHPVPERTPARAAARSGELSIRSRSARCFRVVSICPPSGLPLFWWTR